MRKKIVAGNWKMHKTLSESLQFAEEFAKISPKKETAPVIIPPFLFVSDMAKFFANHSGADLGAQNCHHEVQGAFTGEVSAEMLVSVGAKYVVIGHSERRQFYGDTNEWIAGKVNAALRAGLTPIFCCGEPLEIREANTHFDLIGEQVEKGLFHLSPEAFGDIVIAYEPVWAIGTGKTASPAQAQEVHAFIRDLVKNKYGATIADNLTIQYGGSVKPDNAAELFSQPDVDGGLVGGASLKPSDFAAIVAALPY